MNIFRRFWKFIKSHKKTSITALIILAVLFLIFRPKPAPLLDTQTVSRQNITQTISVSGSIGAKNAAVLSFLTSGTVTFIGAKVNDTVSVGQTIAVLDQRTVLKNLQNALLDYSIQRDAFDQTGANNGGYTNPNNAINDNVKRVLQDNQYNLDKAVVSVELEDLAKQQSVLTSPISGVVTKADVVTTGSTATTANQFVVVDPNSLIFSMDVDEADVGKVIVGMPVDVTLDAYPDSTLHLAVSSIAFVSHTSSTGGNAFTVEAKMPKADFGKYRIGMNGNAEIILSVAKNVLTVPISSIYNDTYVYVAINKSYIKRKVSLGLESDTDVQILSGLTGGEKVVLDPSKVK